MTSLAEPTIDLRERELCATALQLLREVGYDAMSMDALAKRARASKATIYRRWSSKADLVVDALRLMAVPADAVSSDSGSLREDLLLVTRSFGGAAACSSELFASVAHAARTDDRLCQAVRERISEPSRQVTARVVARAVARGDLHPDAARLALFHDLLPALLMARTAMQLPVDEEFCVEVVDEVLLPVLQGARGESGA